MQTESTIKPNKFEINEVENGKCTVLFFNNIVEKEISQLGNEENKITYVYDMYKIRANYRDNLSKEIEKNYEKWINFVKKNEHDELALEIRNKRDKLLNATDKFTIIDYPISENDKQKVLEYRQKLRDLPEQEGFPYNIEWPEKPNVEQVQTMKI